MKNLGFKILKKEKFVELPKDSGVYAFWTDKNLLYIGKAADLYERVKSHFHQPSYRDNLFIDKVKKIGFMETGSEIEALISEAELIKKYQPDYNVVWKDDKNYFYAAITKEPFPRVFITHQLKSFENRSRTIKPFVDGRAMKETLKILRRVFPYRSCFRLPKRPCLWYHLDRCPAPCLLQTKLDLPTVKLQKECERNIKNLIEVLRGKKMRVLNGMEGEMKSLAKQEMFEEAEKIKKQIYAFKKVFSHARIFEAVDTECQPSSWRYARAEAYDISDIQGTAATGSMVVFINGQPEKSQYRKFKIKTVTKPNDVAMLKEVLARRFKHAEWPCPDFILIDGGKAQLNAVAQIIRKARRPACAGRSGLPAGKASLRTLEVAALAKRNNELFWLGRKNPVLLKNTPREFSNIILQLRDEAHRFAKKYHRHLRKAELTKS